MKPLIGFSLAICICIGIFSDSGRAQESFGPSGARVADPDATPPAFGPNYGIPGAEGSPPDSAEEPREKGILEPPEPPVEVFRPAPAARREQRPEPARQPTRPSAPAGAEREVLGTPGVLQRFAQYRGPRTIAAMARLFQDPLTPGVVQKPSIALADGRTPVRIEISRLQGDEPDIALSGAQLRSMDVPGQGPAVLQAVPEKGAIDAAVFVLIDGRFQQIPLTVVPPLPQTELKAADPASAEVPQRDYNDDGELDYVDDYIYVGNLLAGKTE